MADFMEMVKWENLIEATRETIYMTSISVFTTFILGLLLGLLLFLTDKGNIWANRTVNVVVAGFVNIFRSIPFIILIVLLIPFTKLLIGTMLGANAALPNRANAILTVYERIKIDRIVPVANCHWMDMTDSVDI